MRHVLWNSVRSVVLMVVTCVVMALVNHFASRICADIAGGQVYEQQIVHTTLEHKKIIGGRLDDIGGLRDIKDDIMAQIILPLKYPDLFFKKMTELTPCRGVLFCGPPGTGKTMLARAIANESNVPFIPVTLATIENKYYGESAKLLKALFGYARKTQPSILFFDEIDGFMRARSADDQSCVYGLKTELLNLLDGVSTQPGDSFFVIGSTNARESLDPAVRRRLSSVYTIALPDEASRLQILRLLGNETSPQLRQVAKAAEGFSGSDLKELHTRASSRRLKPLVTEEHLKLAKTADDILNRANAITWKHWQEALSSMQSERPQDKMQERLQELQRYIKTVRENRPANLEENVSATTAVEEASEAAPAQTHRVDSRENGG